MAAKVQVFNIPLDTLQVISKTICPANHLTGAKNDLPNLSPGCYQQNNYNYNQVTTQKNLNY